MPLFGPPNVEKMKAKKDIKGLIKALDYEKDLFVRLAAAEALGEIGDACAVEPLIAALKDKFWDLRKAAASALGEIGDARAVAPLVTVITDIYFAVLRTNHMARPGEPLNAKWKGVYGNICDAAAGALVKIGDVAVEPLTAALREAKYFDEREAVANALARFGGAAVEPLVSLLEDDDPRLRRLAAEAVGKIDSTRLVEPFAAALEAEVRPVSKAAVEAVGQGSTPQAQGTPVAHEGEGYPMEGQLAVYTLSQTCLGNPLSLSVKTEKLCVYCRHLQDPDLRAAEYPKGVGECYYGVHSFDDTCEHWTPNIKVRFWLSKGYMEHNLEGWPRKPWYEVFDDGPDGEESTR